MVGDFWLFVGCVNLFSQKYDLGLNATGTKAYYLIQFQTISDLKLLQ